MNQHTNTFMNIIPNFSLTLLIASGAYLSTRIKGVTSAVNQIKYK